MQFDPLDHSVSKIGPGGCTSWLVYALAVSCSFSITFAVQNWQDGLLKYGNKTASFNDFETQLSPKLFFYPFLFNIHLLSITAVTVAFFLGKCAHSPTSNTVNVVYGRASTAIQLLLLLMLRQLNMEPRCYNCDEWLRLLSSS